MTDLTRHNTDGDACATVNAAGNLVDLKLAPSVPEKPRPDLAEEPMRTLRSAQSKLAGAAHQAVPALAGTESMAELDRQYRTLLPELPPEPARRRTLRLGAGDDLSAAPATPPRPPGAGRSGRLR